MVYEMTDSRAVLLRNNWREFARLVKKCRQWKERIGFHSSKGFLVLNPFLIDLRTGFYKGSVQVPNIKKELINK